MKNTEHLKKYESEMLEKLGILVGYNTVQGEPCEGMPFGKENAECLGAALKMADEMGFETCNMDNYCGWAQIGEGEEIIGIAAHLDVVPAGDGWNTDPFTLTQKGDTVYGRGVTDDKGAVIASLYALKELKESGMPINKRIRLIIGCNEETGSECMKYYSEHGEPISMGFTPDGDFPGIFGEKGMCALKVYSKNTSIISMNGGFVSNAVCNRCVTEIPEGSIDALLLENALKQQPLADFTLEANDGKLIITAFGVSAHASMPERGVNAADCTVAALQSAGFKDDFVDFYSSHLGTQCNGAGLGLGISDEYGALTHNVGIVSTENGVISCTVDIRYPVTFSPKDITERLQSHLEDGKGRIEIGSIVEPLFFPPDSMLVKGLHEAYIKVTGDTVNSPKVIGGGTYAKSLKGIIAFGCELPDADNHIHDANESLKIDELLLQTAIYVEAIKNLLSYR